MQSKEKIYGINPIAEALDEGTSINKVFIQRDLRNDRLNGIIQELKKQNIPFQFVPKEKLNRLTMKNHQGIVALTSEITFQSIEDVLPQIYEAGEVPLLVILDSVTDVRNFGAIARSVECFGAHAIVIPAQGSAPVNAEAVKASAGALSKVNVCREINFLRSIKYIKDSGLKLIACTEKAKKQLSNIEFTEPTAIVLGSEGEGIHPDLLQQCNEEAKIPMTGTIGSLNVSVAAGVILYEVARQRG